MDQLYCVPLEAISYIKFIAAGIGLLLVLWGADIYFGIRANQSMKAYHRRQIDIMDIRIQALEAQIRSLKNRL